MSPTSVSRQLGEHLVREKDAHDLSRNPELASFQFLGYRTSAAAVELVALCDADGMDEGDIVRRRDEFFDLVRKLPYDYGLKPRGRNANGLLGFVFAQGCPEPMARFIARQTRISHAASDGGVAVSWAIDVPNRRIHAHDNPVSVFPPVIVPARAVYPGLEYLESLLPRVHVPPEPSGARIAEPVEAAPRGPSARARPPAPPPVERGLQPAPGAEPSGYDVFIAYASEDGAVALELANALKERGVSVWLDSIALRIGDSLQRSIDHGLASARFGVVLLSRSFFRGQWSQREFAGLLAREMGEDRVVVLPLWHEVDAEEVRRWSPPLADKVALRTSQGIPFIADRIAERLARQPAPAAQPASAPDPPERRDGGVGPGAIHILFLAANSTTSPLDLERELERIETSLRLGKERDRLELKPVFAASVDRMTQAMLDESPTIVHFSGHGREEGIVLRDAESEEHLVSGEALAGLFALFRETVRCVVLNACFSEIQAVAIRREVPHVIGMRARIPDPIAIAFSTGFYKALAAGRDVPFAFRLGVASARAKGHVEEDFFVLK